MSVTLRRAQVDDAPAFVRLMSDEAVFGSLMQLPHPSEALWRERPPRADGAGPAAQSCQGCHGEAV